MKQIIKIWFQKYKLHLLIWAIYIFYETVVVGLAFGVFGHPVTYIAHYAAILLFFYLHGNYLLPLALNEKHNPFWCIPLIIIAEVVCFVYLSYLLDKALIFSTIISAKEPLSLNYQYWLKISYRGLYFLGFATGYYYLITALKERRRSNNLEQQRLIDIIERQKTEQELAKAQNAFLKAQINPHFLFNTLDFIYHNIDASSPIAADAVIILTEMMRYAVDADKMGEYIILGDEIEQAENLIYLNQMRKNHTLVLRLNYPDEIREIKFIPLVLLTLLENIFKHGNLSEPTFEASIDIYIHADQFHISTGNLINYQRRAIRSQAGLSNIEKRLKFVYGSDITFRYGTDADNWFSFQLAIPLQRLNAHNAPELI